MGSKSSSKTVTTTEQYDQRILAEQGSIVIGTGAEATYLNEFSDNVAEAFIRIVDFAAGAGDVAVTAYEKSTDVLSGQLSEARGTQQGFIIKALPYFVIIALGVFGFTLMRKK